VILLRRRPSNVADIHLVSPPTSLGWSEGIKYKCFLLVQAPHKSSLLLVEFAIFLGLRGFGLVCSQVAHFHPISRAPAN
jgi:hypothetical protein